MAEAEKQKVDIIANAIISYLEFLKSQENNEEED